MTIIIDYDSKSPYHLTNVTNNYLDFYKDQGSLERSDDEKIVVDSRFRERPDLLSYELYGTTKYWWVFARRNMNKIKDPIFDLQPGLEIFVPSQELLEDLI